MEAKFYANFLGQWCEITSDPEALIDGIPIVTWLQTVSPIRVDRLEESENKFEGHFVDIYYNYRTYTISPHLIQIIR